MWNVLHQTAYQYMLDAPQRSVCCCADASGFVAIDEDLRVQSSPGNVFSVGDVASSVKHPRPKAGVYAVRQGPPLADNIRRYLDFALSSTSYSRLKEVVCLAGVYWLHWICSLFNLLLYHVFANVHYFMF